jgi:hypothetical protein
MKEFSVNEAHKILIYAYSAHLLGKNICHKDKSEESLLHSLIHMNPRGFLYNLRIWTVAGLQTIFQQYAKCIG